MIRPNTSRLSFAQELKAINSARDKIPVDLSTLCSTLGVHLHQAYLDPDISGMLEQDTRGSFKITVNAAHVPVRRRFTIAHELGHYVLHRNLVGNGVDDNVAYRSTTAGKYHNTAIGPKEETQANKFAANLLMPKDMIDQAINSGMEDTKVLADYFEVSEQAMKIRLGRI